MKRALEALGRLANTYCGICSWWVNCGHPR